MKLNIEWKYPDEIEPKIHTHTFYDINPKSINISNGYLYFEGFENPADKHWLFPITHIVEMRMEEE